MGHRSQPQSSFSIRTFGVLVVTLVLSVAFAGFAAADEHLEGPSITVTKKGDRSGTSDTVSNLGGATFEAFTTLSGGVFSNPAGTPCTTDAVTGQCEITGLEPSTTYYVREVQGAVGAFDSIDTLSTGPNLNTSSAPYHDQVITPAGDGTVHTRDFANRRANPPFPVECGLDIAVMIDLSSSINAAALAGMQDAARAFVDALEGTPSSFAGFTFGTNSPVNGQQLASVLLNDTGANEARGWIDGLSLAGSQYTNWDAAFRNVIAQPDSYDVLVFLTDGNPTRYTNAAGAPLPPGNPTVETTLQYLEQAVFSSNGLKALGTKVLGVGIGQDLSVDNIQAITGPVQGGSNPDYLLATDFGEDLEEQLQSIAVESCGGTVTVTKLVETPTGFVPAAGWDFTVSPSEQGTGTTDASGTTPAFDVEAGSVTVTETLQDGYNLVPIDGRNAVCTRNGDPMTVANSSYFGVSFDVENTDIIACTFRNTPERGDIEVRKVTEGGVGGPFVVQRTGNDSGSPTLSFTTTQEGVPTPWQSFGGVFPGTYTLTESELPEGWQITDIDCGDVDLATRSTVIEVAPGETVQCTFTNDVIRGGLTIVKDTDIETDQIFEFERDFGDDFPLGSGDSVSFGDLVPGTYSVDELIPDGWELADITCVGSESWDAGAEGVVVVLGPGDDVTCTFTNTIVRANLTIVKETDSDIDQSFDFDGDFGEFPLASGESESFAGLLPGEYAVTELVPAGWTLEDVTCVGNEDWNRGGDEVTVTLAPGDDVTCTFTNRILEGAIEVVKTPDVTEAEPGDVVTYTYVVTNVGEVVLTDVTAVDDILGPITLATTTLEPGESTTGTATYTVQPDDAGTTIVNIVIATGETPLGEVVEDDDVADVTVPAPVDPETEVGGETLTPDTEVAGATTGSGPLALTGSDLGTLLMAMLAALVAGGALLLLARRRDVREG